MRELRRADAVFHVHDDRSRPSGIFKRLRVHAARATIVYLKNKNHRLDDMQEIAHIAELSDTYALQITANWIATRCGFPLCTAAIDRDRQEQPVRLGDMRAIRLQYPFNTEMPGDLSETITPPAFQLLDGTGAADPLLLASLYEHIVESPITAHGKTGIDIKIGGNGRTRGEFYTPPWVVNYCIDRAGLPELSGRMKSLKGYGRPAPGADCQRRRPPVIIDPACGAGNFLIEASRRLRLYSELDPLQRVECVYGMDIDGRAAALCRLGILLTLAEDIADSVKGEGPGAGENFVEEALERLNRQVIVSDALAALSHASALSGRFDLVIGNPPYLSFGARGQQKPLDSWQRFMRAQYPQSSEYKIRTTSMFQDLSLRLSRKGGKVVLLVPDSFLYGSKYRRLRELITTKARISSVSELPADSIAGATVGQWCVVAYEVGQESGGGQPYDIGLFSLVESRQEPLSFCLSSRQFICPDNMRFRLLFSSGDAEIWQEMDRLPRLSSWLRGHTGLRARSGRDSIVSFQAQSPLWRKGITSGRCVVSHRVAWDGAYLLIDPDRLFKGGFDSAVVQKPKLLVRQTADRIIAAVDRDGLYHLNNVHSFSPQRASLPDGVPLPALCALFNSTLWLYLYRTKTREGGRALAQIDIECLEHMPLPRHPCPGVLESLCRLAHALELGDAGLAGRKEVERAVDRLVYHLYDLPEPYIQHIEKTCASWQHMAALPERAQAERIALTLQARL